MKATMIEFLNTSNCWTWYRVYKTKSPIQAIGSYLKEHFNPDDIKGWKKNIDRTVTNKYYYNDEVRAYIIEIE